MALTKTPVCNFGKKAEDFKLKSTENKLISLNDVKGEKATLIMFICNHCPYVRHVATELARIGADYLPRNVIIYAINSNDYDKYPADAPEKMKEEAAHWGFNFPYLVDKDQTVAKAYQAACTPDIYLFDSNRKLVYRGQLDDSRPSNDSPPSGHDLRAAIDAILNGTNVSENQIPSIGCNIKWKPGNEPR